MAKTNQQRVVDAAIEAFMRYGFRRVTMEDLATAAGISKPTLYSLFPNKQEVFRAAVKQLLEAMIDTLATAKNGDAELLVRVQRLFERWTVKSYRLIHDYPDAREFLDLSGDFAQDIIDDSHQKFEAMLADALKPYTESSKQARKLAHTLNVSAMGIKEHAESEGELKELLDTLINLTIRGLQA